jgi:excisionase family DNA binding protein
MRRNTKLWSVAQVSGRLQCAQSTVRKLVADGELRASRISARTIRISESDLQAYLDGHANVSVVAACATRKRGCPMNRYHRRGGRESAMPQFH